MRGAESVAVGDRYDLAGVHRTGMADWAEQKDLQPEQQGEC